MINVETRPVRLTAVQWNDPRDCPELVVSYRYGQETRYGVHSADRGMQRVTPGDWIVIDAAAQVYSAREFHLKFRILEGEGPP